MPRARDDEELIAYILSRCEVNENGCWLWQGSETGNGYGKVRHKGRSRVVHRVLYELLRRVSLPNDLLLDHLKERCTSRACCNPHHLDPVTAAENTSRGNAVLFSSQMEGAR